MTTHSNLLIIDAEGSIVSFNLAWQKAIYVTDQD